MMPRLGRAAMVAGALAATAFNAAAQEGDIARGHAFAREACKMCHVVEPEEEAPRTLDIGPAFRAIANTPGMTATALRVFLTSSEDAESSSLVGPRMSSPISSVCATVPDSPSG
jgi:cytochrome c551/c552